MVSFFRNDGYKYYEVSFSKFRSASVQPSKRNSSQSFHCRAARMNVSPELLHQIQLAPRIEDVPVPRISKTPTPGFPSYQEQLLQSNSNNSADPALAMKRAFHDHMVESVLSATKQDLTPLRQPLLELHKKLRDLVPNRKDLHGRLQDDRPDLDISKAKKFLEWIMEAGYALSMLESEVESVTTTYWIDHAKTTLSSGTYDSMERTKQLSFLICSLFYLIEKADRAQQEKDSFYFHTAILPKLYHTDQGYQIERKFMLERFPNFDWPITRRWVCSLLKDLSDDEKKKVRDNAQQRKQLIARGWIESIVFQKGCGVEVPEVFGLDVGAIRAIRSVTRLAAAGCAIGLHATQVAQKSPEMLSQQESNGAALVRVLKQTHIFNYETRVEDAVLGLVKEWKGEGASPSLTDTEVESLRQQTRNVLRGEDPVINLLDSRMQKLFGELAVEYTPKNADSIHLVANMRSGVSDGMTTNVSETGFESKAQMALSSQGLSLYAKDLAKAAELASRIPDLACQLYDAQFLKITTTEASR